MALDNRRARMWSDALDMLSRAERLHQQLFEPPASTRHSPSWQPPIDLLETPQEVLILAALPGVAPNEIEAVIDNGMLLISGRRTLPPEWRTAIIHRLELPQGRFERRIPLPPGAYNSVTRTMENGCLVVRLRKAS